MTLATWLGLVTWVGQLAMTALCFTRSARSVLAMPLAVLCFVLFAWNFAEWAFTTSGWPAWRVLDISISPLTAPAGLYFILAFIGARRRLRWLLVLTSAPSVVLGVVCASTFVTGERAIEPSVRRVLEAFVIVLAVIVGGACLFHHERTQQAAREKLRTRLLTAALVIGGVLGAADVLRLARIPVPSMLVTTGLLALVVLRFELFDREPSRAAFVYALAAWGVATLGYLALFHYLAADAAVTMFAAIALTAVVDAATIRTLRVLSEERATLERLGLLGRMSAQMAHDVKNPLTSILGAAQFLKEERAQGRSIDDQEVFLDVIATEAERLARLVDRYRRLGDLELALHPVDLGALVRGLVETRRATLPPAIRIELECAVELPRCDADPDVLLAAFENLLANAVDAVEGKGCIRIRVQRAAADEPWIEVSVSDDGIGMNPRQRERVFEEFFTTKPSGSGLGLPFAKRVAEAHRGRIELRSEDRVGTEVRVALPCREVTPSADV